MLWAIDATGRRLAGISTCLVRAVVVEARLSEPTRPLRFAIGVRRSHDGALHSHAWVADADRVLIGAPVGDGLELMVAWETAA